MGTDLNLDLWGNRVGVRTSHAEARALLRSELADHVVSEGCPVGFILKLPGASNGLYSLLDRSGLVLARSRGWEDCIAVLAEMLTSFAPAPAGTVRMTMRAVLRRRRGDAALVAFPLLSMPPVVERQMDQRGLCVVDRLAVDFASDGVLLLSALPWSSLRRRDPVGHGGASASGARVGTVLLPSPGYALRHHEAVSMIAATAIDLDHGTALDLADRLSGRAQSVPINDETARRHALAG